MKTCNIFISHSWNYHNAYDNLVSLLENRSYFDFHDYSVPKDDPVHTNGTDRELREAIGEKIKRCHVVLVVAGMYATYSKWINIEIKLAQECTTPIIAIEGWGSQRTSAFVKDNAHAIVKWNVDSVVNAIREHV